MIFQILKRTGGVLLLIAFIISGSMATSMAQGKPAIQVSESTLTAGSTNSIKVTGSGFTPNTVVVLGVQGLGLKKYQKTLSDSKDLLLGIAEVENDGKFDTKVTLRQNLWRVRGISGDYTLSAQNELDEKSNVQINIKPAKKKGKKKK